MKVAVLADIHANIAALSRVLDEVRKEGITQLVLLGDIVGYYYEPAAVIAALSEFECTGIEGNHDRMAREARQDRMLREDYGVHYGSGLEAVFEQFGEAEWTWLEALPVSRKIVLGSRQVLLAHGAPFDPDAYIYPNAEQARFDRATQRAACDAIWLGHTHWPFLRPGPPDILNPGSVGQPRDIGGLASWAIYHVETGSVAFRRTEYPTRALIAECEARDPAHTRLRDILVRGRIEAAA